MKENERINYYERDVSVGQVHLTEFAAVIIACICMYSVGVEYIGLKTAMIVPICGAMPLESPARASICAIFVFDILFA